VRRRSPPPWMSAILRTWNVCATCTRTSTPCVPRCRP
jgi:hypothetical protein